MESRTIIKNLCEQSKNHRTRNTHKKNKIIIVAIFTFTTFCMIILTSYFNISISTHQADHNSHHSITETRSLHLLIKKTCKRTLYPSLCFSSLASVSPFKQNTTTSTFHRFLHVSITRTMKIVVKTRFIIMGLFKNHGLTYPEKNALNDCVELLDQTLYELQEAVDDLHSIPTSYGNFKSLLSAAMTNENTCIDGLSELDPNLDSKNQKNLQSYLQRKLNPISKMVSNCLAIIKYMESINRKKINNNENVLKPQYPPWMIFDDRILLERHPETVKPDLTVAKDGSGDYRSIREALKMAPNKSKRRFVIKIKGGVYNESVVISREKVNIMLFGDGMNSTVITGSKNFADGYSTFTAATLTVIGNKFIARDMSVINTSGPKKHQAVAIRVTSNSAFYRCNFTSYQDTLYAHSLRQFYRDCTIQGTIDFIFGNAAAIFQNCHILVGKPLSGQKNMITAQGRGDPNQNTGISLQNCTITAAPEFNPSDQKHFPTFLGRPWRNYSRTVIMNSYLGDLVDPLGWFKWDEYSKIDKVEYIEYKNYGPGSNLKNRVNWVGFKKNCSNDCLQRFTVGTFLHGADEWLETTGFPLSIGSSRRNGGHVGRRRGRIGGRKGIQSKLWL